MGSFGERLRREREMRGITLEEIAEATKIGTRSLRALEQEQFDILPGGIFNKGFVRAYARFLGIDEEQAVADYLSVAREDDEMFATAFPIAPAATGEAESTSETPGRQAFPWGTAAAVVVAIGLISTGWYGYQRWKGARQPAETMPLASVAPPPPSPAPQAPTVAPTSAPLARTEGTNPLPANSQSARPEVKSTISSGKPAGTGQPSVAPIMLRIRARSAAWLEITADDRLVMSAVLPAAGEKVIRADKRVVLDIGNAGGVEVTHNGKLVAPFGPEGKRRIVTFTPNGLQQ